MLLPTQLQLSCLRPQTTWPSQWRMPLHCCFQAATAPSRTAAAACCKRANRQRLGAASNDEASTEDPGSSRSSSNGRDGQTTSSSNSSSSQDGQRNAGEAWALMGRVVSSDRLVLGQGPRQRLVLLAAARNAGVSLEVMEARLQELLLLLPDLASLLPSLHPKTLALLGSDTQGVAQKLIKLRLLFPSADVSQMISRRPTLLLDEEFEQVEEARAKLVARLAPKLSSTGSSSSGGATAAAQPNMLGTTGSSISNGQGLQQDAAAVQAGLGGCGGAGTTPVLDGLVSRQPLLLVRNVDSLLDELERLLPSVDVLPALVMDPDLITQVMCNRNLSLW